MVRIGPKKGRRTVRSYWFRMKEETYQQLKAMGAATWKPVSALIREAIDDYLKAHTAINAGADEHVEGDVPHV